MTRSHLPGRLIATTALLIGSASALTLTSTSPASAAGTAYGGSAFGDIVHATTVTIPTTLQVADVAVAPADAEVSSAANGLKVAPNKQSYAKAANLNVDALSGAIPLNNLIVEADQSAPPDNAKPATANLLSVPAAPLLNATVADASAHARWLGPQCLPVGTPISTSTADVATATVLPSSPIAISVVNSSGGPVTSTSAVGLVNVAGSPNEGVQAVQADQITGVVLFAGTANQLTVNVLAPPVLTAIATGLANKTSTVKYTEPVLQIVMGGKVLATLDAATANTSFTIPALATLSLGKLTDTISADGTTVNAMASLLEVAIGVSPLPLNVATIDVAPAVVSAFTPAGGVVCPPPGNPLDEAHKDASAAGVAPGQTFNYTVTVPNRGTCTLSNVQVVDTVTGPANTAFVSSTPAPTKTAGLVLTYNLGTIAANATDNIQITIRAPAIMASGAQFHNHADISGVCNGQTFTKSADINFPQGFVPSQPGCYLDSSNKAADHTEVFNGETFNYYIHVFNAGQQTCSSVSVTDVVPSNVTFVSASNGGTLSGGTVTWPSVTLGSGQSETLVLTVAAKQVASGVHLANTATITSPSEGHPIVVTATGPLETGTSILAGPNPAGIPNGPTGSLPRTGGLPLAPYGLALLVAGFLLRGWRRRAVRAS